MSNMTSGFKKWWKLYSYHREQDPVLFAQKRSAEPAYRAAYAQGVKDSAKLARTMRWDSASAVAAAILKLLDANKE